MKNNSLIYFCVSMLVMAIVIAVLSVGCATKSMQHEPCPKSPELSLDAYLGQSVSEGPACAPYKILVPNVVFSYTIPKGHAWVALKIGNYYYCYYSHKEQVLELHSMRLDIECGHPVGRYAVDFNSNSMLFVGEYVDFIILLGIPRAYAYIFTEEILQPNLLKAKYE